MNNKTLSNFSLWRNHKPMFCFYTKIPDRCPEMLAKSLVYRFIGFVLITRIEEEEIVILPPGPMRHPPLTYATRTKHTTKRRASLAMLISVETFSKNKCVIVIQGDRSSSSGYLLACCKWQFLKCRTVFNDGYERATSEIVRQVLEIPEDVSLCLQITFFLWCKKFEFFFPCIVFDVVLFCPGVTKTQN